MTLWLNEHPWFWLSGMLAMLAAIIYIADLVERWMDDRERKRTQAYVLRGIASEPRSHVCLYRNECEPFDQDKEQ